LEENNSVRKDYKTEEFAHINFPLQLVLGETILTVKELLDLKEDSVIVLDRLAADSATLLLNGRPLAEGEIVVFNDCFAFRINSLGENGLKNSNSKEEEQAD
jgi:flagellar motor switch protein FliN